MSVVQRPLALAIETVAAFWPKAGFAGREASRHILYSPEQKEGARGEAMGSPGLLLP